MATSDAPPTSLSDSPYPEVKKKKKRKRKRRNNDRNDFIIRLGGIVHLITPTGINDQVKHENASGTAFARGVKVATFDTLLGGDIYTGYEFFDEIDLGMNFSYPNSQTQSGSGSRGSVTYALASTLMGVKANYEVYHDDMFRFYGGLVGGLAFHKVEIKTTGPDSTMNAKGSNIYYGAHLGTLVEIDSTYGVVLELGYRLNKAKKFKITEATEQSGYIKDNDLVFTKNGAGWSQDFSGPVFSIGASMQL